jgi:hypothetical protein
MTLSTIFKICHMLMVSIEGVLLAAAHGAVTAAPPSVPWACAVSHTPTYQLKKTPESHITRTNQRILFVILDLSRFIKKN